MTLGIKGVCEWCGAEHNRQHVEQIYCGQKECTDDRIKALKNPMHKNAERFERYGTDQIMRAPVDAFLSTWVGLVASECSDDGFVSVGHLVKRMTQVRDRYAEILDGTNAVDTVRDAEQTALRIVKQARREANNLNIYKARRDTTGVVDGTNGVRGNRNGSRLAEVSGADTARVRGTQHPRARRAKQREGVADESGVHLAKV